MAHPLAKTGYEETLGDGTADGHGVALSERSGGVLDTALGVKLGVTGCGRAPLTELLKLIECIVAEECEHAVKHGRHVTGVEEETVAAKPLAVIGVGDKKLRVKHVYEIRAAHGSAGMAGICFFNHRSGKDTDVVGRTIN